MRWIQHWIHCIGCTDSNPTGGKFWGTDRDTDEDTDTDTVSGPVVCTDGKGAGSDRCSENGGGDPNLRFGEDFRRT